MKTILCLFLIVPVYLNGQNIYSALHLNGKSDYKTAKPKKIIETNTFFNKSGKQVDKNIKLYDNAGMIISEERFNEDGNLTARLTYTNDTANKIHLSRTFERKTAIGTMIETAWYSYDSHYQLIRVTDKTADGNLIGTTEIVNNAKGLPVELTTYDANGNLFGKETADYAYDHNMAITTVYNRDGKKLSSDSITINFRNAYQYPDPIKKYNEQGDLVISKNFEYEYQYDKSGNCTEEKIYKVTIKPNGKKQRKIDRIFKKVYSY